MIRFYSDRYEKIRETFFKWNQNLLDGFKYHYQRGAVECFTTAATHAFLPYIQTHEALEAQVDMGIKTFKKYFGELPKGFWLPECAYTPGIDKLLHQKGIRYTFVDEQTLLNSSPKATRGIGSPYSHRTASRSFQETAKYQEKYGVQLTDTLETPTIGSFTAILLITGILITSFLTFTPRESGLTLA